MAENIKWGIMGLGRIAHSFAKGLSFVRDAELTAVGSRSLEKANGFSHQYGVQFAYGSYEELVRNDELQIIYIATPHGRHYEDMLLCLEHGKAVLCEKSFTLNAEQAKHVFDVALSKKLFVMEALWTRFLPVMSGVRKLLAENTIGRLRILTADLGINFKFDSQSRLFNPNLGGGALLDLGVYPVSLSQWLLGIPISISSEVILGKTKVDEQEVISLRYDGGILASLFASIRSMTPSQAIIMGTEGMIKIHAPLYNPSGITLVHSDGEEEYQKALCEGNGYNYEIEEANRCLRAGITESLTMPWADTIAVMEIMDTLRDKWGMHYPQESV